MFMEEDLFVFKNEQINKIVKRQAETTLEAGSGTFECLLLNFVYLISLMIFVYNFLLYSYNDWRNKHNFIDINNR